MSAEILPYLIAAVSALFGMIGVFRTQKATEKGARVTADAEIAKVVLSSEDHRSERLDDRTEAHFQRIERSLARQEQLIEEQAKHIELQDVAIKELQSRVAFLEDERKQMISWMAFNKLGWPPPPEWVT